MPRTNFFSPTKGRIGVIGTFEAAVGSGSLWFPEKKFWG
jgi:hypothetical protein